jgi:phage terminase Nu1 subunit (DNA packaging protein)
MTAAIEAREHWVTKQQLADHLQVTRRWIELQQHHGLPYMRMGGMNRYIVSEVEAWLRERYASTVAKEGVPDAG